MIESQAPDRKMILAELQFLGGQWQVRKNGLWSGTISFDELVQIVGDRARVHTTSCEYQVLYGRDDYTWGFHSNNQWDPMQQHYNAVG